MNQEINKEFVVTARKWRPLNFADLVGQDHVSTTLLNAIKSDRVHHAFLFSGPRGVGKTTSARILARALNCESPVDNEPCNKCQSCISILEGRSMDVIEIDGASNNSVDDVRKLRENAKYPPVGGHNKMYIIDEVHMLSTSAFNALLKTLEEPPPHLIFVFATTESHKVPATILSRCQRFEFRRMEIDDIVGQLKFIAGNEGIQIDAESLVTIAKKADGSMRDSQSIFDQVVAFCGMDIKYSDMAMALNLIDRDFYFRISTAVLKKDLAEMFTISAEVISKGFDLMECLSGVLEHFRNLLTLKVTGSTDMIESSELFLKKYVEEVNGFNQADLLRILNIVSKAEQELKYAPQPRIRFELALVQIASLDSSVEIEELIKEIRGIKNSDVAALPDKKTGMYSSPSSKPTPPPAIEKKRIDKPAEKNLEPIRKAEDDGTPKPAAKLTAEEINAGWEGFKKKYATGSNGLSIIKQARPEFLNMEIILVTDQTFVAEGIKQKSRAISLALEKYYGAPIRLKVVVGEMPEEDAPDDDIPEQGEAEKRITNTDDEKNKHTATDSSHHEPKDEGQGRHPVEQSLIDLFDAKQVSSD